MLPNIEPRSRIKRWKRPIKRLVILTLILIVLYLGLCAITLARVYSFRKHPNRDTALDMFQGDLPHNLLGRMFLFKSGTYEYNSEVLAWAYQSRQLSDSSWNRWMLERAFAHIPDYQRLELLPFYPLTPTQRLLPDIKNALEQGQYEVLPLLARMKTGDGPEISRRWVKVNIVEPQTLELFVFSSGVIAETSAYPFVELASMFWPRLSPAQKDRVIANLAARLTKESPGAKEVFEWVKESLRTGSLKMTCPTVALISRFASIPSFKDETLELVAEHAYSIDSNHTKLMFYHFPETERTQLATTLFEKLQDKNSPVVLEIIHELVDRDILEAEEVTKPFLSGPDSQFKKGVIVLLVRHESVVGKRMIEETFRGNAPRTMLYYAFEYSAGNPASETYRRLSTHDYQETGKTWPPSYFGSTPSSAEISEWKQFIETYPWFPGTDDAYYRLALSQFAQGDHRGSLDTIKKFLKREYWPDDDARPYIYHLLRNLAMSSTVADSEMPFLPHLRTIVTHPLASSLRGEKQELDSVIKSINWFLANPKYIQLVNTDQETLKLMLEVALIIKKASSDSVCRLVAAKLNETDSQDSLDEQDRNEIADEESSVGNADEEANKLLSLCTHLNGDEQEEETIYPAGRVSSVLYAVFRDFTAPPSSALRLNIPNDAGEEAIRQTAIFLNLRFTGVSVDSIKSHRMDEPITLALLHNRGDFNNWKSDFQPTMDFLSVVNNSDVPGVVAQAHLKLLEERKR